MTVETMNDPEVITVHTIKGNSSFLGYRQLVSLGHASKLLKADVDELKQHEIENTL